MWHYLGDGLVTYRNIEGTFAATFSCCTLRTEMAFEDEMANLTEMGFETASASSALERTGGNVDAAIEQLLGGAKPARRQEAAIEIDPDQYQQPPMLASIFMPTSQAWSSVQGGTSSQKLMRKGSCSSGSRARSAWTGPSHGSKFLGQPGTSQRTTVQTKIEITGASPNAPKAALPETASKLGRPLSHSHDEPVAAVKQNRSEEDKGPPTSERPEKPRKRPAKASSKPLAERMRPVSWNDLVGQAQVRRVLQGLSSTGALPSLILWGPPGCGKTTLARMLACKRPR